MRRGLQTVGALTVLAAALRFPTLGVQSYWYDEAVTAYLVGLPFDRMLAQVPSSESTPHLYTVLAWLWAKPFGTSEWGLRSLSALLGTLTVPVVYATARALVSRRAALYAGALAAVSPMLVWYSQEARAYVLLVLLSAVSLYYFVRYLKEPRTAWLAGWGIASALALLSHYFAGFLIAAELVVLLVRAPSRRLVALAFAPAALTGLALLPTVLQQKQHGKADWIGRLARGGRIKDTAQEFLLGPGKDAFAHASAVAALLCLVAVAFLFTRGAEATRRAVVPVAAVAALTLLLPLLTAFAGSDYVFARNMLPALVPLLVVVAAGLAVARPAGVGIALTVALCGLSIAVNVAVATRPELQRRDSRGAAADLGTPDTDRVIVLSNPESQAALGTYMPRVQEVPPDATVNASEVDFVAIGHPLPVVPPPPPAPGFRLVAERSEPTYRLQRWRSDRPAALSVAALRSIALLRGGPPSNTLVQFQPRAAP